MSAADAAEVVAVAADDLAGVAGSADVDGSEVTAALQADRAALATASLVDLAGEGSTMDGDSGTTVTLCGRGDGGGDSTGE